MSAGHITKHAISLGIKEGKTNQLKTGSLTTTATTADQVILTFTVTTNKTFYVQYASIQARLTTMSTTQSILGAASLETPSGTKGITVSCVNPSSGDSYPAIYTFSEPIAVTSGVVIRWVCTPAAATSMLWVGCFGGYEI